MNQKIWYHGTHQKDLNYVPTDYCNTGLGLFLTPNILTAEEYAGSKGYIMVIKVSQHNCFNASEDEFWCRQDQSDIDHMGNITISAGEKMKQDLISKGYDTIFYYDPIMKEVLVILNDKIATVVETIKIENFEKYTKKKLKFNSKI